MCGIAGYLTTERHDGHAFATKANSLLGHRGPDGRGSWSNGFVTLAHVRLSVIDRSPMGAQPMTYNGGQFQVVFNGEIYNYPELRRDLESRGHSFLTKTDTEVIPAAYLEWGDSFITRLRGAFAFALWDQKAGMLILARDRLGEKPLFYTANDGEFVFASELVALFRLGGKPLELDSAAIDLFFHYGYVPEPANWIKGLRRLEAGTYMKAQINGLQCTTRTYWDFTVDSSVCTEPKSILSAELQTIGNLMVRSDVPVGIGLSGGIDSSAIAALAARHIGDRLHAFTVGYPDRPPCDERSQAAEFAKQLGIPCHEVEITDDMVVEGFPALVRARNEPFVDVAGFSYLQLFRAARNLDVPVMLLGQGGDELFWGYGFLSEGAALTSRHISCKKKGWRSAFEYLTPDGKLELGAIRRGWEEFAKDRREPFNYIHMMEVTPDFQSMQANRNNIFSESFLAAVPPENAFKPLAVPAGSQLSGDQMVVRAICKTYLRENGMAQADRLAMSSGVEVRLPLCDYRLAELSLGLKGANSDRHLEPKYWLRQVMQSILPDEIFRRPKQGFAPPVHRWIGKIFKVYGHWLRGGHLVAADILNEKTADRWSRGDFEWDGVFPAPLKALSLEAWCRMLNE